MPFFPSKFGQASALYVHQSQWCSISSFLVWINWSVKFSMNSFNCLCRCNDNFPINLGLLEGSATSWLLKSTSATTFTMQIASQQDYMGGLIKKC